MAHVVDGRSNVALLALWNELFAGCASEGVERVLVEARPGLELDLICGVEEVEAVARVRVEGGGGEAAGARVEAVRVEAEQVDAIGLLHADEKIKIILRRA